MNDGCVIRVEIVDGIHFPALCHYPIESLDSREPWLRQGNGLAPR
jgi:hypothetical protein